MTSLRLRTIVISIGMSGTALSISGCSHQGEAAAPTALSAAAPPAAMAPASAAVTPAQFNQRIAAQHAAGAEFDAKQRAASMARMKVAGAK